MGVLGRRMAVVVVMVVAASSWTACGDDDDEAAGGSPSTAEQNSSGSIPRSLGAAESAAEDSIDLILAGKREATVESAATLVDLAGGDLADDLDGVATEEEIADLNSRAEALARIAPDGEPVDVALAANHAFELIAGFFGRFDSEVPGEVLLLDYYDFEAKLRALAEDIDTVRSTVGRLSEVWNGLRADFPSGNGGTAAGKRFDAHVAAMQTLVGAGTDFAAMVKRGAARPGSGRRVGGRVRRLTADRRVSGAGRRPASPGA